MGLCAAVPVRGWFYRRSVSFYAALTAVASGTVLASIYFLVNTVRRWKTQPNVYQGVFRWLVTFPLAYVYPGHLKENSA